MEWNVKNAVSRDVERQHLNKILREIRSTVDSVYNSIPSNSNIDARVRSVVTQMIGDGLTVDPSTGGVTVPPKSFTLTFEGEVTGQGTVVNQTNTTIQLTVDPSIRGVPEAPTTGGAYWRKDAQWEAVPYIVYSLTNIQNQGFAVYSDEEGWLSRVIEVTSGDLEIVDGDGVLGNPTLSLPDITPVVGGNLYKFGFDAKGRRTQEDTANTDDLPEGAVNLYFPEAPIDGNLYGRQDGAWAAVPGAGPTGDLVAGANVTLTGTLTDRLLGAGNVTISASGGGGGGGGDVVLIAEVVTTGSQATVTFSSIPSTYRNLELRVLGRGTAAAGEVDFRMRFNNDTGANYKAIRENRFGVTVDAAASFVSGFSLPGALAPANYPAAARIGIPNYKGTAFYKGVETFSPFINNGATMFTQYGGGWWASAAAINRIDIFLSSGNWVDGSVISLYGMS